MNEKGKCHLSEGKFRAISGVKGYNILLTCDKKIPSDDADKTKDEGVTNALDFPNKTSYNELILSKGDTVYFQISEESNTKSNKYGNSREACMKLSRKCKPTTGSSKKIL